MTRYEKGFLTKCAEYGVDGRPLLKRAFGPGSLHFPGTVNIPELPGVFGSHTPGGVTPTWLKLMDYAGLGVLMNRLKKLGKGAPRKVEPDLDL